MRLQVPSRGVSQACVVDVFGRRPTNTSWRELAPHAVARLSGWNGPMKPPLEGGAIPSGQMRSLVSPWPSSGAAAPQSAHASRIIAVAWCSATQNGMPCSDAIRWYCRSRAICGSTRDLEPAAADGAEGSAFRLGNFCSITRRHLLHCSAPTPPSAAAGASSARSDSCCGAASVLLRKKPAREACLVVSVERRHAKQSTATFPSRSSAIRWRFWPLAMVES
mmetsp:Transcript_46066/g.146333  ORF Transcript_46066/g.146333 Transcript_46066/m.146333 type:complete len:221 (+) Transcript_46066:56-718(+)